MRFCAIHDKNKIRDYLRNQEVGNFVHHCNNLESPFWDQTQWYGLEDGGKIEALAMFILRYETPVLLSVTCRDNDRYQKELLGHLKSLLPVTLYSHMDVGHAQLLADDIRGSGVCGYYNMRLTDASLALSYATAGVLHLGHDDRAAALKLLAECHPDHLFDDEFFAAGYFWGIKQGTDLISLAGVTALSKEFNLISIGNVTTHPGFRRQGLATKTVAALLKQLLPDYSGIVLNVKQDNSAALGCYRSLGFSVIGSFEEVVFSPIGSLIEQ